MPTPVSIRKTTASSSNVAAAKDCSLVLFKSVLPMRFSNTCKSRAGFPDFEIGTDFNSVQINDAEKRLALHRF